jgi:hypothetical protein
MDKNQDKGEEMIPFFSVASKDFDQDLTILKKVLDQLEQRTHSDENAYKFSQKVFQLAVPPGFPSHDKKGAAMKIVDMFQNQIKQNGSEARIKMYGDIPFATPWWSWLFK